MDNAGILTGLEILEQCRANRITIIDGDGGRVLDPDRVNSNSYDLTLGNRVAVYSDVVSISDPMAGMGQSFYDYRDQILPDHTKTSVSRRRGDNIQRDLSRVLDARKKLNVWEFEIDPAKGWLLKPGIGYLMHTVERIWTMDYVPVLDGKSSIGRLFLTVHVTAGYGDTGFDGQYTLEVVAQYPTIVYPGMRFGQMRFHTLKGEVTDYKQRGNYTGEASLGPVPSMAYRQFENQVTKPTGINAANLPPADSDSVDAAYGSGYGCHNG